jgi:CubicO group peptidase (beta-lactamase class C family)
VRSTVLPPGFDEDDYDSKLPKSLKNKITPGTPAAQKLTPRQQREALSVWQLKRTPRQAIGKYAYSNAGYEVAAWLAEVAAGETATYEGMLKQYIFNPLDFTEAGAWAAAMMSMRQLQDRGGWQGGRNRPTGRCVAWPRP